MIILGDRHQFSEMEMQYLQQKFSSINHISYKDTDSKPTIKKIENIVINCNKSIILLNTKAQIPNELLSYLVKLEIQGTKYLTTESFLEQWFHKCYIPEDQSNISFLEKIKPYATLQYIQKRFIDYSAVVVLGILTIPVLAYTAYRIRKESPGSIFFKQSRVGLRGRSFTCFKFRSMHENSHHNPYTQENDSRIFPWGDTMRKNRIDELPQLLNILKGDMHLLGPRAEWDILVENYEKEIPYYNERHLVRPGITGWAQVNYPYGANTEDARQKLMYDLYYIKYWTLWLEIKTALKTTKVVFGGKGR